MREKQNKRTFLASSLVLLLFLNLSLVVAVQPLKVSQRDNVFWVVDIGDNIADFAVADGKVFTRPFHGVLYCFDQNYGSTIWNYTIIYDYVMWGPLITVADGKVFTGSRGSVLNCLNENTGEFLWEFQPNLSSSFASKTPPLFTVADGKVFTTGDGFYSVNATNGELIWGYEDYKSDLLLRDLEWVVADGRVFIAGIENTVWYLYSLNADNGEVLWKYKISTFLESSPIVADGRVFVWDRWQNQVLLCLNETSGSFLWNYDVGAQAFQPTISDGLVLFGASDGNFYALNESDGTLKWKYQTGLQIDAGYFKFAVPKVAFGQVFIGYELVSESYNEYEGYVRALNQTNGQPSWTTPISNNATSGSSLIQSIILTLANHTLYVTTFNDLYSIDSSTGNVNWTYHFTYWVLPPIYAYSKLFVAADLKVIVFDPVKPPTDIHPTDLYLVSTDYPDTVLLYGNSKSFEVKATLKNGGYIEAKNVMLVFQPNFGDIYFVSKDIVNIQPEQTSTITIKLNAVNTGATHEANFLLKILYETAEGKTKSLDIPSITVTIVPASPPPFYATPLGIVALVIVAFLAGAAIMPIILRKKQRE